MADHEWLIDQALALTETARVGLAEPLPITPEQAMVWCVYLAAVEQRRGRGSDARTSRYVQGALSAGIQRNEIDATLARAEADAAQ